MAKMVNQKVNTPIGEGIVQGAYAIVDDNNQKAARAVLVRLPINEATKPHLRKSNCMTPKATASGLWVFQEDQVQ